MFSADEIPMISVVTVVLNESEKLNNTIDSVLSQDYPKIEHVIIDGGSTDGTIELVNKINDERVRYISEPDHGIYDAMNKGSRLASGDWIIFLNSGDKFVSNTTVSDVFVEIGSREDLIYGDTYFITNDAEELVSASEPETLWKALNFNHNSLFTRRDILLEHPFTSEYKIVADSEFVIWAYKNGKSFHNTKIPINKYERGGYSDINSVMRTVERWKLVSDARLRPQDEINDYYFQRLLWEDSCKKYLHDKYNIQI